MHPSQKALLRQAERLTTKLAATNIWKYTCPDTGKVFYTAEKQMTIRSPFTGKTFASKPERSTLSGVGQELREEAKKTAASNVLWKYVCPDTGKEFWLQDKVRTIRSPWTSKTFATKPERESLSDVGQELREEAKAKMASNGPLEKLATQMVGDGGSPNFFFVTNKNGQVKAVIVGDKNGAIDYAKSSGLYLVEDRKTGEVWGSAEYERVQSERE